MLLALTSNTAVAVSTYTQIIQIEMQQHWARYDFMPAQQMLGLKHAETIVTLSGAHTVGHSKVHKKSPTSLGKK
jgi:hypothetical protein